MDQNNAQDIVSTMFDNDAFSQWLGIEILEIQAGFCKLSLTIRKEMTNGFAIAHGGITYSLADSALAFAANSRGKKSVSIETSISHIAPCKEGDVITAIAEEQSSTNKIAIYQINMFNQSGDKVALFKGTVYRTGKKW